MKYIYVFLILICSLNANGQNLDSSRVVLQDQIVNEELLAELRNQEEYSYIIEENQEPNFFGKLWQSIKDSFNRMFSITTNSTANNILKICAILAALFGLFYFFSRSKRNRFFEKSKKIIEFELQDGTTVDSHMDFDKMVTKLISDGDYKKAIQVVYIQSILWLGDQGRITPQKFKSNANYLQEINDDSVRDVFASLTEIYEYVHFGDFEPTEDLFVQTQNKHLRLKEITA